MTDIQKEIASVEEFEKTLTYESPIPVSWAIRKFKAQHELIEQKDAEIEQLKDQRNRALAEWEKVIETAEIFAGALKLIKYMPSSHSYSRAIADDVLTRLGWVEKE